MVEERAPRLADVSHAFLGGLVLGVEGDGPLDVLGQPHYVKVTTDPKRCRICGRTERTHDAARPERGDGR